MHDTDESAISDLAALFPVFRPSTAFPGGRRPPQYKRAGFPFAARIRLAGTATSPYLPALVPLHWQKAVL